MILFLYIGISVRLSHFKETFTPAEDSELQFDNRLIPNFMCRQINSRILLYSLDDLGAEQEINQKMLEEACNLILLENNISLTNQEKSLAINQNTNFLTTTFEISPGQEGNISQSFRALSHLTQILAHNMRDIPEYFQVKEFYQRPNIAKIMEGYQNMENYKKQDEVVKLTVLNSLYITFCKIPISYKEEQLSQKAGIYSPSNSDKTISQIDKNLKQGPKDQYYYDKSVKESDIFKHIFSNFWQEHIYIEPKIIFLFDYCSEDTKRDGLKFKKVPITGCYFLFEFGLPFGEAIQINFSEIWNSVKNRYEFNQLKKNCITFFKNLYLHLKNIYYRLLNFIIYRSNHYQLDTNFENYEGFPTNVKFKEYIYDKYKATALRWLSLSIGFKIYFIGAHFSLDIDRFIVLLIKVVEKLSNIKNKENVIKFFEEMKNFFYAFGLSFNLFGIFLITISRDFALDCWVISFTILFNIYRSKPQEYSALYGVTEEASQQYSAISKDLVR